MSKRNPLARKIRLANDRHQAKRKIPPLPIVMRTYTAEDLERLARWEAMYFASRAAYYCTLFDVKGEEGW